MKITICGSMACYSEMKKVSTELISSGHEVRLPDIALEVPVPGNRRNMFFGEYIENNGGIDAFPPEHDVWNLKQNAMENHFRKIDWADAVLVVNQEKRGIPGYIGGNTLIEMGIAFRDGKKIFILNHVSSSLSYKQEIIGMRPVILAGDLAKI